MVKQHLQAWNVIHKKWLSLYSQTQLINSKGIETWQLKSYSPRILSGVQLPHPIKLKARGTNTAKANPFGTASRIRLARFITVIQVMSPTTTIAYGKKISAS